ncbi:MAG: S49 family peptidase, partial [Pseudomonadota bacterium]
SIGILSMVPTYERTLGRLGVYTDGVGSTTLAGALRVDKDLSPQVRQILQLNIEDGYRDFVGTVAESRGMTFDEVDAVAQGKVWLGREAIEIGLIDELGDLDDAVQMAADAASLERDYSTRFIEPELSEEEKFLMSLLGGSARLGISAKWLAPRYPRVNEFLARAEQGLAEIARYNDPMYRYAMCFCEVR